jgi:hypothetical protein
MFDRLDLAAYVDAGYGVLLIDTKAYDTGSGEHLAAATLLCAGQPMMSARAYEAMLLHKCVRYLRETGRAGEGLGLLTTS